MTEKAKRICILGGGFGGLYTALRLDQLQWQKATRPEIIIIDKNDRFLFSPLLYELVTGEMQSWEVAPSFADLLAETQIQFKQAVCTDIDLTHNRLIFENQESLSYDYLVLGVGGKTAINGISGVKEYAIPFKTLEDAYRLQNRLKTLEESNQDRLRIVVAGAGTSGIELACKLVDRLGERGKIRIVDRNKTLLKNATPTTQEIAREALSQRKIWLDLETEIKAIRETELDLEYREQIDTIPVDLVIWTGGTQMVEWVQHLPLEKSEKGQLKITETLQIPHYPHLFAVGDIADYRDEKGTPISPTAQLALQQADYCAWNLWAILENRPLLPFRYQNLGEMLTLGTDDAIINGLGLELKGNLAYITRRLIYLYRLPTLKHQLTVGLNWITQPLLNLFTQPNG